MKHLLLISLFFLGCTAEIPTDSYTPVDTNLTGQDKEFLDELNSFRESHNLPTLKPELILNANCSKHSYDMYVDTFCNHNGFWQRYTDSKSFLFGEIVAYNFTTASGFLTGYESSEAHNEILINPKFTHIGIAHYGLYQCVEFANYTK